MEHLKWVFRPMILVSRHWLPGFRGIFRKWCTGNSYDLRIRDDSNPLRGYLSQHFVVELLDFQVRPLNKEGECPSRHEASLINPCGILNNKRPTSQ